MPKEIIYQILPRLWGDRRGSCRQGGSLVDNGTGRFSDIDAPFLSYLKSLGVSCLWLTGVVRHATLCSSNGCSPSSPAFVKGQAGSPYSITDWFDVNPYLADDPSSRLEEFCSLIGRIHSCGLKVLTDFVPNHVSRDYGSFSPGPIVDGRDALGHPVLGAQDDSSVHWKAENDFYYYPGEALRLPSGEGWQEYPAKASGNCFSPSPGEGDWYDTVRLNYCPFHTPTWDKMLEVVLFWASLGVDGMRCDMVEMVPVEFMSWLIAKVKERHPGFIFIAEVYQKERYGEYIKAGFDYLYDKSGMYDALYDIVVRGASASALTGVWQMLGHLQPRMLNFLENHDEVRLASPFFASEPNHSFAALYASLFFNTAPFMLYFGQEVGERGMDSEGFSGMNGRTSIFDWWAPEGTSRLCRHIHGKEGLSEAEKEVLERYEKALSLAGEPIIKEGLTYDLCYCCKREEGFDKDRHFVFLRGLPGKVMLFGCNFSSSEAEFSVRIPSKALSYLGCGGEGFSVRLKIGAGDGTAVSLFV